jgi:hypothetical protein
MQGIKQSAVMKGGRRITWRRRLCAAGGAAVEAGSGVAAHWRRLQAVALLSQAAERGILPLSFSSVSFPLLLLLLFFFFHFFLSSVSLFFRVFFPLLPLFFFFFVFLLYPPLFLFLPPL